jgi:UDP-N-acetylglucosamine 2-epimerase (non-hydrolysing)
MKRIASIFGTRPEAIKMAPVVLALREQTSVRHEVLVTAQHREMLDQVLQLFKIQPDFDLDLMQPNQSLGELTARAIVETGHYLDRFKPDLVLVQGDTTTVLSAALAAYYRKIPIGHVEAGLRTGNIYSPWPEEANRKIVSAIATLHFAPTQHAQTNLINEGIAPERIFVTGNTVIDALLLVREQARSTPPLIPGLPEHLQPGKSKGPRPMILITGHRRENFGEGFESICRAIAELAELRPGVDFVYPVHLNPHVQDPVGRILGPPGKNGIGQGANRNIYLIDPLSYLPFVAIMDRSTLILTDSGGVQEEAPSLGVPVLVMRDTTERPEAIEGGTARLVGTDHAKIVRNVLEILDDSQVRRCMAEAKNPYGDGTASKRIVEQSIRFLGRYTESTDKE